MRTSTACRECRIRKRKCNISVFRTRCTLCVAKDLECSATPRNWPSSANAQPLLARSADTATFLPSHTSPSSQSFAGELASETHLQLVLSDVLRDELIHLYFEMLHDKQHALFHRPTFDAQLRRGEVPEYLTLAMMALVARFSLNSYFNNVKPWDRGRAWAIQSKRSFDARATAISVTAIQACALLGNLAFIEGDSAMESLYAAQAIRMVQILGLPRRLNANRIQREIEIRVWWTTWMMDTWTSASMGVVRQLCTEPDYETPMEEVFFDQLGRDSNATIFYDGESSDGGPRESGLWTQMIPLTTIMGEIHSLNKKTVSTPGRFLEIIDEVKQLSFKLDYWLSCLPPSLHNTTENLQQYSERGIGRTFAALHFGYHYHAQLLYYQFLHRASDPNSVQHFSGSNNRSTSILAHKYATRCKYHASELSKLMWTTNTTPGLECLWPINGHLLVIASSVHLHTLLFEGDENLLTEARCMLEHNFMMLQQMQKYWPCLEFSTSRLSAFHRACQDSTLESFDMDDWMLHFLQEYALPVSDRFAGFDKDFSASPEAWSHAQIPELHRELTAANPARGGLGALLQRIA